MTVDFATLFVDWLNENYPEIVFDIEDLSPIRISLGILGHRINANDFGICRIDDNTLYPWIDCDWRVYYGGPIKAADPDLFEKAKDWMSNAVIPRVSKPSTKT